MLSLPFGNISRQNQRKIYTQASTLYVLAVAAFPITLPAIIALFVYASVYISSIGNIGAETRYAKITYPVAGTGVPERFKAYGIIKKRPPDTHLFLSSTTDKLYWPKIPVNSDTWEYELSAPGSPGYKFDLVVIAVSTEDKKRINEWFMQGRETGKYPGISQFSNLQTIAKVKVERSK